MELLNNNKINMANLLQGSQFNAEEYDNFLKRNDYLGAANYLTRFKAPTLDAHRQIQSQIEQLKTMGARYNAVMQNPNLDDNTKQAFSFMSAWNNGANANELLKSNNNYAKQFTEWYQKACDAMFNGESIIFDSNLHKSFGFLGIDAFAKDQVKDETGFDLFCNRLGLSNDLMERNKQLSDLNISFDTLDDGRTKVRFANTGDANTNIKIIQALFDTDTNHSIKNGIDPIDANAEGELRWEHSMEHPSRGFFGDADYDSATTVGGMLNIARENIINNPNWSNEEKQRALDKLENAKKSVHMTNPLNLLGEIFQSVSDLGDALMYDTEEGSKGHETKLYLRNALNTYNSAKSIYNNLMTGSSEEGTMSGDIQVFNGIPTIDHGNLIKDLNNGVIDTSSFNARLKNFNDYVTAQLSNLDKGNFFNQDIYAVDYVNEHKMDPSGTSYALRKVTDVDEKQLLAQLISANAANGKVDVMRDVAYAIAPTGDGYMVTINADPDALTKANSENPYYKDYTSNVRKTIFIPNLIDSEDTQAWRRDSQYKAIQKQNEIRYNNVPIEVSTNQNISEIIRPKIVDGVIDRNRLELLTQVKGGVQSVEDISMEDALSKLEKRIIVDDAINEAYYSMYDDNGNFVENPNLEKQLDVVATEAATRLSPRAVNDIQSGINVDRGTTFIEQLKSEILSYIYQYLQIKQNS